MAKTAAMGSLLLGRVRGGAAQIWIEEAIPQSTFLGRTQESALHYSGLLEIKARIHFSASCCARKGCASATLDATRLTLSIRDVKSESKMTPAAESDYQVLTQFTPFSFRAS